MNPNTQKPISEFTHDGLAHDLANHLRTEKTLVWENMQMGQSGSCRPDVYFMRKSFADPRPTSYEVKISLSDFRSDVTSGKWESYLPFSRCVIFATPKGLIKKEDLPQGVGWIVRHENVWRMARKPTLSPFELTQNNMMKLLIDGVDRLQHQKSYDYLVSCNQFKADSLAKKAIGKKYGNEMAAYLNDSFKAKGDLASISERIGFQEARYVEMQTAYREKELALMQKIGGILNVDGDSIFAIRNEMERRMRRIIEGDELAALRKKISRLESALDALGPMLETIKDDEWVARGVINNGQPQPNQGG